MARGALLREAVRGSQRDFTREPLSRAIPLLAIPMVLEMVMESVFVVVDIYWVAQLGPDAVAAVGLTEAILTIIYALAMGVGMGATAVVARRIGEGDQEAAAHAAVMAVALGIAVAVILGLAGGFLAPHLLALMGASASTIQTGAGYTRVTLGGSLTVVLLFVLNAVFRGAGDAAVAMRTLWLANGVNIALGPFLIFGWGPFPEMGVVGAAVATTIGRGVGVGYQLASFARSQGRIRVLRRHLRYNAPAMERCSVSLAAASPRCWWRRRVGSASCECSQPSAAKSWPDTRSPSGSSSSSCSLHGG
jgi:putative MATE family efflux protein